MVLPLPQLPHRGIKVIATLAKVRGAILVVIQAHMAKAMITVLRGMARETGQQVTLLPSPQAPAKRPMRGQGREKVALEVRDMAIATAARMATLTGMDMAIATEMDRQAVLMVTAMRMARDTSRAKKT